MTLLVLRRHTQPLKYRGAWLLLCSGIGGYLGVFWLFSYLHRLDRLGTQEKGSVFCELGTWVVWVTYPLLIIPYLLRGYRVFAIFSEARLTQLSDDPDLWKDFVVKESYLLKLLLGILVLFVSVQGTLEVLSLEINVVGYGCGDRNMLGWVILHICEVLLLFLLLLRIKGLRDDYGVNKELMLVALVWSLAAIGQFSLMALDKDSTVHHWFGSSRAVNENTFQEISSTILIVRNIFVFAISVIYPVFASYSEPFMPLWSNCNALRSLDSLLKDYICMQYFRNFLASEKNEKLIYCWVEIELFMVCINIYLFLSLFLFLLCLPFFYSPLSLRLSLSLSLSLPPSLLSLSNTSQDLEEDDDCQDHAEYIYDKYLCDGAQYDVDISSHVKERVRRAVESHATSPDLFREVHHELFMIMNNDFPRFLASDICRDCLKDLEREEHLRSILEASKMI